MGSLTPPKPVLLFLAVFAAGESAVDWARRRSVERFGPIELESDPFRFDAFTSYYARTMGDVLLKRFWAFRTLIDPADLASIKRTTNDWEAEYRRLHPADVARPLNLDPGYVDLAKLILASTKDHAHRIYLSGGIFAETTLMYTQKRWKALPWTYPDYQSDACHDFLNRCREALKLRVESGEWRIGNGE